MYRTELMQRRSDGGIEKDRGMQEELTVSEPDDSHVSAEVTESERKFERALGDPQVRSDTSERRRSLCASA